MRLRLELNGRETVCDAPPLERLADVLHDRLGVASVNSGCADGSCASCRVLLGGEPVASCLVPALQADGSIVTTFEGLHDDALLAPLFARLAKSRRRPCEKCLPGLVVTARAWLDPELSIADESAEEALAGCRCSCQGFGTFAPLLDSLSRKRRAGRRA